MGPVFVRRGEILFVIKSADDFFECLESGKILPTDNLLVKDADNTEWLPISEIAQFQLNIPGFKQGSKDFRVLESEDIFDHIKQPRFNLAAFAAGGVWHIMRGMKSLGCRYLLVALMTGAAFAVAGIASGLSLIYITPLLLLGWFGVNYFCALRADHDLNLLQVNRFHRNKPQDKSSSRIQDPETLDFYMPTFKEKALN